MKKIFALILLGGTIGLSYAQQPKNTNVSQKAGVQNSKNVNTNSKENTQKANVPTTAAGHFEKNYPGSTSSSWTSKDGASYENNFVKGGVSYTAKYDKKGNWSTTENKLNKSGVPNAVLRSLSTSKYKNSKVNQYKFVKSVTYTRGVYVIEVVYQNSVISLYYNSLGNLLRTI